MEYYCTLFDNSYLPKGLALYQSLLRVQPDFVLYLLAIDKETEAFFNDHRLARIRTISIADMETAFPELTELSSTRTRGEFCWTLTPFVLAYCLRIEKLPHCVYLDADLFFFANPAGVVATMEHDSVLITEHRYTPTYDQTTISGKYCVQFVYFKNDAIGLAALDWWRLRCAEWCYDRVEDGKFGDQKYLDDWTTRFTGVRVSDDIGFGLAPWNIQQYEVRSDADGLTVKDLITRKTAAVVFYHFHSVSSCAPNVWYLGDYDLPQAAKDRLYEPYIAALRDIFKEYSLQPTFRRREAERAITLATILKHMSDKVWRDLKRLVKDFNWRAAEAEIRAENRRIAARRLTAESESESD